MPEDEVRLLRQDIRDQTAALSGEIQINALAIKAVAEAVRTSNETVTRTVSDVADLRAKQGQDDDARKYLGWAWTAAKWAAVPVFAIASALGTAALADHGRIGDNAHEIVIVKERVLHVEELRSQAEANHRELLRALRQQR